MLRVVVAMVVSLAAVVEAAIVTVSQPLDDAAGMLAVGALCASILGQWWLRDDLKAAMERPPEGEDQDDR